MIIMNTRAALDGIITTRGITEIMNRIMRLITGLIAQVIIRIIMHKSRHVEHALRKISTIIITTTTIGGTFGNGKSRTRKPFMPMANINVLWPGFLPP